MSERKNSILSLAMTALAIVGAVATVFSCLIAFVVLVNPTAAQRIIIEFYNPETPTPQVIVITQPAPSALPTSTPVSTNTSEVIIITATSLSSTSPPLPTSPPPPTLLFQDDFNSGLSPVWEIVSGNPVVVNDALTASELSVIKVGDLSWTNYVVEFEAHDLRYKQRSYVGVRVQDLDNMIALTWGFTGGWWSSVQNGEWLTIPQSEFGNIGTDPQFRISVENKKIDARMGNNRSSFVSNQYLQGGVLIGISPGTIVDNFKITALP